MAERGAREGLARFHVTTVLGVDYDVDVAGARLTWRPPDPDTGSVMNLVVETEWSMARVSGGTSELARVDRLEVGLPAVFVVREDAGPVKIVTSEVVAIEVHADPQA